MTSPGLDSQLETFRQRHRIPGLSVAIARGGSLVHAAGYGMANLEHPAPAKPETIYQTASIGKQFTAALVLLLVERGLLTLDEPIAPRFKSAPAAWNQISVRRLMTHTAGISDEGIASLNLRLDYTDEQLFHAISSTPLEFPPGSSWDYSNSGYVLLGLLIAAVTGRFYGDLLREWIFQPLGMNTAQVISERDVIPNRAAGYELDEGILRNQEYVSPSLNRTADGGLYVTVLDLARWDQALYEGEILSASSREILWTPAALTDGRSYPYGCGWYLTSSSMGRLVEHEGEWQGFSSYFARYLDDGLSIMALANLAGVSLAEIAPVLAPR